MICFVNVQSVERIIVKSEDLPPVIDGRSHPYYSFPIELNARIMRRQNFVGHVQQIIDVVLDHKRLHDLAIVGMSRAA